MSKFWKKALAIFAVLAMCLCVFAACTPDDDDGPADDDTPPAVETPTQDQINLENMTKFGNVLAASLGQNPNDGLYVDLTAALGFAFAEESKKQYDWSYGLSLKAGVFINDTEAIALEIKDRLATEAQVTAGEDVVFGLYNTNEGNLYLQIRQEKAEGISYLRYNFSDARVSTAIKSILLANGVNLDVVLNEIVILPGADGKPGTSLGGLISTAMTMLAGVTDTVAIEGNDYVITTSYKKIYAFVNGLVGMIPGMTGETLDTILPDSVKNMLPDDISLNIRVKTDGKVITGVKLTDSFLDMKDDTQNGTFNFDSDFSVAKTVPETFDVAAIVAANTELVAVQATKILNLNASGIIDLTKTDNGSTVDARLFAWKFAADLDVLQLAQANLQLTDPSVKDNFLQFQLSLGARNGETVEYTPILDLAWGPDKLGSTDLALAINYKALLPLLLGNTAGIVGGLVDDFPSYILLNASDTAIGALLGGTGGAIPVPGNGGSEGGSTESGGSTGGTSIDINGIATTITNLLKEIKLNNGEMLLNVQNILNALGLDAGTKGTLNMVLGYAETARFYQNKADFATFDAAAYDLAKDLKTLRYNADGSTVDREYSKPGEQMPDVTGFLNPQFVTAAKDGKNYLKAYTNDSETERLDASQVPVSIDYLNSLIGTAVVKYTGTDFLGNKFTDSKVELVDSWGETNTHYFDTFIKGYIGLDPTKIGEPQEITVVVGATEGIQLLQFINIGLAPMAESFDMALPDLDFALKTFKATVVLGEVDNVAATLTDPVDGANVESKVYSAFDEFNGNLNIEATVTFKPNKAYPFGKSISYTVGADDSQNSESPAYISKVGCTMMEKNRKVYMGNHEDFEIEVSVLGTKLVKTVKVLAPDSVESYLTRGNTVFAVGDTVGEFPKQWISFRYTYGEKVQEGLAPQGGFEWANFDELGEITTGFFKQYKAKTPGVLKTTEVTIAGAKHYYEFTIVEKPECKVTDVRKGEVVDKKYSVTGTLRISDALQSIAGKDVKVKLTMKSYADDGSAKLTTVSGVTLTFDNGAAIPNAFTDGFVDMPFTITGVPETVKNFTIQLGVNVEERSTSSAMWTSEVMTFESSLVKTADIAVGATLGSDQNNCVARLTVDGKFYYLYWLGSEKAYKFRKTNSNSADIPAIVTFKETDGNDAAGYDATNGKVKNGIVGTFRISAEGHENLFVEIPVNFPEVGVKTTDARTKFTVGEEFKAEGIVVTKTINGTETTLNASEYTVNASKYKKDTAGVYAITVSLKDDATKTATYNVTVLEAFKLKTGPTKTSYTVGEALDLAGLVLKKSVEGVESECVASDYTVDSSKFNNTKAGEYKIVFVYAADNTKKVEITVTVQAKLRIASKPNKLTYTVGDNFDPAGIVVKQSVGGVEKDLKDTEYVIDSSAFNKTAAGKYTITVKLAQDNSVTATFEVEVKTWFEIKTKPTKTEYAVGEELDLAGLVVVKNVHGVETVLTAEQYVVNASAYDKTKAGTYTIVVRYGEDFTKTAEFTVTVSAPAPEVLSEA